MAWYLVKHTDNFTLYTLPSRCLNRRTIWGRMTSQSHNWHPLRCSVCENLKWGRLHSIHVCVTTFSIIITVNVTDLLYCQFLFRMRTYRTQVLLRRLQGRWMAFRCSKLMVLYDTRKTDFYGSVPNTATRKHHTCSKSAVFAFCVFHYPEKCETYFLYGEQLHNSIR
jgi:hypothetical protein